MTGRNPQVWSRLSGTVTDSAGARVGKDPIDKHPDAPLSAEDKHKHTYIIIADIVESSLTAAHRYSTGAKSNHSTTSLMALFHCMVRYGSARLGTAHFGSVAFPPQFSTAIEWAGLFTRRYNCAASTAVTSS